MGLSWVGGASLFPSPPFEWWLPTSLFRVVLTTSPLLLLRWTVVLFPPPPPLEGRESSTIQKGEGESSTTQKKGKPQHYPIGGRGGGKGVAPQRSREKAAPHHKQQANTIPYMESSTKTKYYPSATLTESRRNLDVKCGCVLLKNCLELLCFASHCCAFAFALLCICICICIALL